MHERQALAAATRALPDTIAAWMRRALEAGEYRIAPWAYETDVAVCPVVAAAMCAGVWEDDGAIAAGHPAWGTPDGPSDEVEEFAAWFDLCSEIHGVTS